MVPDDRPAFDIRVAGSSALLFAEATRSRAAPCVAREALATGGMAFFLRPATAERKDLANGNSPPNRTRL